MGEARKVQKERFSRAWVVAAAAAADFTYRIVADDEHGVDMTVHGGFHTIDLQLKATSHPHIRDGHFIHDLDVRTYDLLRAPTRSAGSALVLVVVDDDVKNWLELDHAETRLKHCAYYLPMIGMPATLNGATVRINIPVKNRLTANALKNLMATEASRWAS